MEETSTTTVLLFPSKRESLSSEYQAEVDALPSLEYDEEAFNKVLALERKRSERSKRPFMLMLLSLARVPECEIGNGPRRKILSCLASCKRDIDVLGWYRSGSVIGIIFTEIGTSSDGTVSACITDRIRSSLASNLDPGEIEKIDISFYLYPEKPGPDGSLTQMTLYPDIKQSHNLQKKTLFLKRVIDIAGSLTAIVVSAPLFLVISALIKLTSEGPVFFRQKRVGQYGKTFTFLKFRSMFVNNDSSIHKEYVKNLICAADNGSGNGGPHKAKVFKIQNDPRVTLAGRFLRGTSLDELPQFINVLMGDMSLVGPRPPIPYELENYDLWHRRRLLDMKPGITGMWQVEGRSTTTFNEMVRLDIYYMTNWSIWLDLKLLFKTPLVVLTRKGGY
ncbi:MAG: sugar transferase [Syntrophobacteraceae bacterium]|jgi:lipopolysaccharide/colanic/teichoic acid biosynthesis glycosyltransferase